MQNMQTAFKSSELQQQYERNGFVKVPFLDTLALQRLQQLYEERPLHLEGLNFHSTMFAPDPTYRKLIDEEIKKATLPHIGRYLNDYAPLFANYIVKYPGKGSEVGIHQDWSMTDESRHLALNIWCPLINVNHQADNGVLYLFAGTHKVYAQIRYTPFPNWDQYENIRDLVLEHSTPVTFKAGEAIIYNGATIHYSTPNNSDKKRLAIGMSLLPGGAPAYHYFLKEQNGTSRMMTYGVNSQFFHDFVPGNQPKNVKCLEETDYQTAPFQRQALLQMLEQRNAPAPSGKGFLGRLFQKLKSTD